MEKASVCVCDVGSSVCCVEEGKAHWPRKSDLLTIRGHLEADMNPVNPVTRRVPLLSHGGHSDRQEHHVTIGTPDSSVAFVTL